MTCAGALPWLEEPERPISTPTPIASSSTPTPAMMLSVLLRWPAPPTGGALGWGATGGAPGGDAPGPLSATAGFPAASTLLIGSRRSPHSRQ